MVKYVTGKSRVIEPQFVENDTELLISAVATRRCVVATVFWWYAIGKNRMLIAKGGHRYDLWGKNTKAA